jgi:hypothetical protein
MARQWNQNGYEGSKPRFPRFYPSKLTDDQKEEL